MMCLKLFKVSLPGFNFFLLGFLFRSQLMYMIFSGSFFFFKMKYTALNILYGSICYCYFLFCVELASLYLLMCRAKIIQCISMLIQYISLFINLCPQLLQLSCQSFQDLTFFCNLLLCKCYTFIYSDDLPFSFV